jgi:hypothetical protein
MSNKKETWFLAEEWWAENPNASKDGWGHLINRIKFVDTFFGTEKEAERKAADLTKVTTLKNEHPRNVVIEVVSYDEGAWTELVNGKSVFSKYLVKDEEPSKFLADGTINLAYIEYLERKAKTI